MIERKARQLAYGGALLIVSLILLCAMLNLVDPQKGAYRTAFFSLLGVFFLYCRAIPRKLWIAK
jgi:hypothetical protein